MRYVEKNGKKYKVIWEPQEGSQALALSCPCNIILLDGSRGPGKTDAQLMFYRKFVGLGYGAFWRGVIFDKEYKNLDDLVSKSKRWFPQFKDGAKFLTSPKDFKWVWPTGEELWFRTLAKETDYWNYHGHEFAFIGFNELTKHPNLDLYDMTFSLNRTSFVPDLHSPVDPDTGEMQLLPEIPLVSLSTTNPYGVGHNAVKRRFVDPAKPGEIVVIEKEVFNPRTQEREKVRKTQVRLFGSYRENKFLSPQYVLELENIQDINKRKAWLEGDWDITAGGMFDDIWSSQYNVVPLFNVPPGWRIFRSFDWGSSRPFSVGWWAESNGDDLILPDNSVISTIKGDLFRVREWYGWTGKANTGVKMLSSNITKGIVQREINWGWYGRVGSGPADSSIFTSTSASNIAKEMAKQITLKNGKVYKGVGWLKSDKSPGSRKIGWELMRVAIANAQPNEFGAREAPGLFVTRACQDGFLRTVPGIPRDPDDMDDVDTESEDHVADESRYVILSTGNRFRSGSTIGHA